MMTSPDPTRLPAIQVWMADGAHDTACGAPRKTWFRWVAVGLALGTLLAGALALHRTIARQRPILTRLEKLGWSTGSARLEARRDLLALQADAAPVLVRVIRRGKSRWHTEILPWLDAIPQVARVRSRQLRLERSAIDVLQRIGPPATPAVLDLLSESRFGGRETAIALLRSYGAATCPDLVRALQNPRPSLRAGAALALGRFTPAEQGGLQHLTRATRDSRSSVRAASVWALAQMHDHPEEVVPALAAALADPDPEVQLQAVQGLRIFGIRASPALDGLRRLLRLGDEGIRAESALTLTLLGESARPATNDLLQVMRHDALAPARQAATALVQLDCQTDESLARLTLFLRHPDLATRARTADVVGMLGERAQPLVPTLLALLQNDEPRDDRSALGALRNIQPSAIPESFRRGPSRRP